MTPDDKFQQSGTIRPDPAPLDAVTSSKAGLSTAGTRITRVSSRQTAMTSRSYTVLPETFPVTAPGRSGNARRQTDPLGLYTTLTVSRRSLPDYRRAEKTKKTKKKTFVGEILDS